MNCLQNSEEYNHELKYIITLDGGTTNTRAYLWRQDGSFVSSKKERAGVRNTAMDGSDQVIRETVKRCIDGLIEESHIEESRVQGIFCSGMLTSNVGLEEIPYLCAPVDERALCNAIECRFFNDITRIPFYMIPGVRNHVENIGIDTLEQMDVMRGKEQESVVLDIQSKESLHRMVWRTTLHMTQEFSPWHVQCTRIQQEASSLSCTRKHHI